MYIWAVLKVNVKTAKILWTITEPCSNLEFLRGELKSSENLRISSWSYDVEGSCHEMCGTIM